MDSTGKYKYNELAAYYITLHHIKVCVGVSKEGDEWLGMRNKPRKIAGKDKVFIRF
jgi:hypothetical protein